MNHVPEVLAQLVDVERTYDRGGEAVVALRDVRVDVRCGELLFLMGRSGSGKSTFLHLLAGLDLPTRGQVNLSQSRFPSTPSDSTSSGPWLDLKTLDDESLARLRRRHIGIVFQRFNLLPSLSSRENVALPLLLDGTEESEALQRATSLLQEVDLGLRLEHRPDELSGGERQRVAIARALVGDPALILADEPTGNLDSVQGQEILAWLRRLVEEQHRTVVIVTHDEDAARPQDRVLHLKDGVVVSDSSAR